MSDYVFVTEEAVRNACKGLGISDWSKRSGGSVEESEAQTIRKEIGGEALEIPVKRFKDGLEVELEHWPAAGFVDTKIRS